MNRAEALRILGLDDNATTADIKAAYREMAQILHPDRFANNKKLTTRAEEQFKHVNEARDTLLAQAHNGGQTGKAGRTSRTNKTADDSGWAQATTQDEYGQPGDANYDKRARAVALKARLAGIAAARVQLSSQLDHELDSRRIGIILLVGGLIAFIFGERSGMRLLDALGGTALIWGAIQTFSCQANIRAIREHLTRLSKERSLCEQELEEL